jgi:hypothetical protein
MNAKLRLPILLLVIGIAIPWSCLISPEPALARATVVIRNEQMTIRQNGVIPGFGPYYIEYEAHVVTSTTTTPGGRINIEYHSKVGHFEGTFLDTGLRFHGSQVVGEHISLSSDESPAEYMLTSVFTAITRGSADNFIVHSTIHVTINANGEVTANVDDVWMELRG